MKVHYLLVQNDVNEAESQIDLNVDLSKSDLYLCDNCIVNN